MEEYEEEKERIENEEERTHKGQSASMLKTFNNFINQLSSSLNTLA